jgi:hypothetical protein
VREHEELEVLVGEGALLEGRQHLPERRRRIDAAQREGRYAPQRDLGDRTERAEADARGAEYLGLVMLRADQRRAVRQHQRQLGDLRGDVAQPCAGAVRGRRDRPGDRLDVDVAEVLHREPPGVELRAELADGDPRLQLHEAGRAVGLEHAVHASHADHHAVGQRDVAERVPGAHDAHRQPLS